MAFLSGDTVKGWIVIDDHSSALIGFYETEQEALCGLSELGAGFIAGYGEKERQSDNYLLDQKLA